LLTTSDSTWIDRDNEHSNVLSFILRVRKREYIWALPHSSSRSVPGTISGEFCPVLEVGGRENSDEVRFGDNDAHPPVSFTSIFGLEPFDVRVSKIREGEIKDRSSLVVFGESSSVVGRVSE